MFLFYCTVNWRENDISLQVGNEEKRTYVDNIIKPTVLCDGNDGRGVVGIRVDGCKAIATCWETGGNVCGELSSLRGAVDALEERKSGRVEDARVRKVVHLLDDKATLFASVLLEGRKEEEETHCE